MGFVSRSHGGAAFAGFSTTLISSVSLSATSNLRNRRALPVAGEAVTAEQRTSTQAKISDYQRLYWLDSAVLS